ncbi:hypothetical protein IKP85_00825 [bacterium]|nr:hypothetical protein [bacterium]
MVMTFDGGVPFDPGFVQHISAILPNIEYTYSNLAKYKNFGQKKNQFKMIFPKLEELIDNYIGFYAGCILWAQAIKTLKEKPITGNYCCGGEYNEDETLQEVRFLREYLTLLPKDVKYYIGKDYTISPDFGKVLDLYEDFLKVNEGFIKVEKTDDIVIPDSVKPLKDTQKVFDKIEEVIENGKLAELTELII